MEKLKKELSELKFKYRDLQKAHEEYVNKCEAGKKDEETPVKELKCDCLHRKSSDGKECVKCPKGQLVHKDDNTKCMPAPTCEGKNQILGLGDAKSCFACRTCTAPQVPSKDRQKCHTPETKKDKKDSTDKKPTITTDDDEDDDDVAPEP